MRCYLRKGINEGTKSPLFSYQKMFQEKVNDLLQAAFDERPDLFLIKKRISPDKHIKIVIDGDQGVLVEDCMFVSRAIEHNLDREEFDFSIEVLSSGAAAPLQFPRQYKKHIGRILEISTIDDKHFEGVLKEYGDENLTIQWKAREPKPVGKGKHTVIKTETILFNQIKEAKVKIKF